MQQQRLKQISIGVGLCLAFALGVALQSVLPFARPTEAQGIVLDGNVARSDPAAPAGTSGHLTYQGRLTTIGGIPVNSRVTVTFTLYSFANAAVYSTTRTITPTNGLFTVYLGDGNDVDLYRNELEQAAFVGVAVGADAEMFPRQPLNSVVGHSDNQAGVLGNSYSGIGVEGISKVSYGIYGTSSDSDGVLGISNIHSGVHGISNQVIGVEGHSTSGDGVEGTSTSNVGVLGTSTSNVGVKGTSTSGTGVLGSTTVTTTAGVEADGAGSAGIALSIFSGGIQVIGAGISTTTPVFVHVTSVGNITTTNQTIISHTLTNNRSSAILIVTPVNNYSNLSSVNNAHPIGVFWRNDLKKWVIYNIDGALMPVDTEFNVLVVNP